jgi:hypothetical protein
MKKVLKIFFTFKIWILANLTKYSYRWSSLEKHHKNEKKKTLFTLNPHNMWMVLSMKNKSFGKYEKEIKIFYLKNLNIAEFGCYKWLPLEQHHKIEKKTHCPH